MKLETLLAPFPVESRLRYALRNLRHLYEQMLKGQCTNQASAALGLLGPAIQMIEAEEISNPVQQQETNANAQDVSDH